MKNPNEWHDQKTVTASMKQNVSDWYYARSEDNEFVREMAKFIKEDYEQCVNLGYDKQEIRQRLRQPALDYMGHVPPEVEAIILSIGEENEQERQ